MQFLLGNSSPQFRSSNLDLAGFKKPARRRELTETPAPTHPAKCHPTPNQWSQRVRVTLSLLGVEGGACIERPAGLSPRVPLQHDLRSCHRSSCRGQTLLFRSVQFPPGHTSCCVAVTAVSLEGPPPYTQANLHLRLTLALVSNGAQAC